MKPLPLVAAIAVGGAALWSAGWFVGKSVIVEPEVDRAVEDIRAGRLFFSYGERTIGGFPFGYDIVYHDVAVSDSTTTWRWTVPELHVATGVTNTGQLTLTTSPRSALEMTSGGTEGPPAVFEIETKALEVHLAQGAGGSAVVSAAADEIAAVQKGAGGLITGGRLILTDMAIVQLPESQVAGEVDLRARQMEIAYRMSADGVTETWSENVSENVLIRTVYDVTGYDAAAPMMFVTEGGSVSLEMTVKSGKGRSGSTGGPSAPPFTADFETGPAMLHASVGDGRMTYGGSAEGSTFDVNYAQGGPLPQLAFEMGDITIDFSMPTEPSPEPQPYALLVDVADVNLDEAVWSMFDSSAALPRDAMSVRLDFIGDARIFRDLMALQAANLGGPPIELETLVMREARISAMGAAITATGELDVRGAAARPDGEITVVLDGALALVDRLTAAGIIPAGAGDIYKSMGHQILRPGEGDDQFIADVVSKGGRVSVNGTQMGQ